VSVRRLSSTALEKVWGTPDTEPWYPRTNSKIGEVWFTATEEPRLLLKFLFTSESLSVQVHPSDSTSGPGKTEMWHVLRAAPGARLALGFEHPLTPERARAAALSGEIESLLHWYDGRPGDTFFVPAGTVHAIGAGLALCEIQQHSDVTYRLYDYGRPRELHLDAGLAVAHLNGHPGVCPPVELGDGHRLLAECPYFRTESIMLRGDSRHKSGANPEFLICIEGAGSIDGQSFSPGDVWLVEPARDVALSAPMCARLLRTFVP
jgi:mannose-6-phosphate isomerase